jgi:MFS transporter, DHA2 family, multidrug resistance protein
MTDPRQAAGPGGSAGGARRRGAPGAAPLAERRAGRREWLGLAVLALPCMLYSMDLTVLNLAVPSLSADLAPTSTQLLWIVDIYGFVVAGALVTMGTLGDRIGRRRLLLIGASAFGVASVLAAFSVSAEMLIATRAVLGLAGATIAPSTLSLLRNMFHDPRERTTAVGVWITSYSVGAAIGPLVGGVLLQHFWWGSVFLAGVPVMILLLLLGPVLLPEYRDPAAGRLDLPSAGLSLVAVLAVIYGLKQLAEHGPGWRVALALLGGLAAGASFVRRQRRLADPLIDLGLFRLPAFRAAIAAYMLATFAIFGCYVFVSQYLQLVLGLSPLEAGLWTLPFTGGFVVGAMLTPLIVRRFRPAAVIAAGLAASTVGFAALTQVGGASGLALLVGATGLYSLCLAPVFTLTNDTVLAAAPPERAGAASAISETSSELGGALGIALLGSLGAALYHSAMADAVPPGVPPDAAEAARGTLGAALALATELPGQLGVAFLGKAREAFTEGLQLTAAVSAVTVLATAAAAAVALRRRRSGAI